MDIPFLGSEALAANALTPYALRSRFTPLYPNVYLPAGTAMTAPLRARAAWLWSRRRGVVAGRSAAALHGAKWVDGRSAAQVLWPNRHPPTGLETWSDAYRDDDVAVAAGVRVTTVASCTWSIRARNHRGKRGCGCC